MENCFEILRFFLSQEPGSAGFMWQLYRFCWQQRQTWPDEEHEAKETDDD